MQPDGITALETPIGSALYIASKMEERIARERMLWEAIPTVPASNARSKSYCRAQTHARITECAHCRPLCPRSIAKHTMKASGALPKRCWGGSLVTRRRRTGCDVAHAVGRSGPSFSSTLCARCILGLVGRFVADDPATNPRRGHCSGAPFGQCESSGRLFGGAQGSWIRTSHAILANGHTVGNIGHPPLPTPTTGGSRC